MVDRLLDETPRMVVSENKCFPHLPAAVFRMERIFAERESSSSTKVFFSDTVSEKDSETPALIAFEEENHVPPKGHLGR
jgi:hypothetical protein